MYNKSLVISIYNYNYRPWISLLKDVEIFKYNKNSTKLQSDEIPLPNVGREPHTYFHHIIENYDNLSDYVFFSQDNPLDHASKFVDAVNGNEQYWETISRQKFEGAYFFNDDPNWKSYLNLLPCPHDAQPYWNYDMKSFWEQIFENPWPGTIYFTPGMIFVISKEVIQSISKEQYKKLLSILETQRDSPWAIERIIYYIFNNKYKFKF